MESLLIKSNLIGNINKGLEKYHTYKKKNSRKWADYWLGVIDTCIYLYEDMFKGEKSRAIEIAKEEINYGK